MIGRLYFTCIALVKALWRKLLKPLGQDVAGVFRFCGDYRAYERLSGEKLDARYLYPRLRDWTTETPISVEYFFQDAWAFAHVLKRRPDHHVDVGSHHKLVSLMSKAVPVTMLDIRPLPVTMDTIRFQQGSILELPFEDGSMPSVSSICVVEHIGLGRYGDPQGSVKATAELKRIVAPGGWLYVSMPVDDSDRIYFNAHRAFTEVTLETWFAPFEIVDRKYIFGTQFVDTIQRGYGVGCHALRAPPSAD
jgi:SAM-dependent methyltransferase